MRRPRQEAPFKQAEFTDTDWGPVPARRRHWAGVRLDAAVDVGYSHLVTCLVEHVTAGGDADPLVHYRGRYPRLG